MDKIWIKNPEQYSQIENESRKEVLYPQLLDLVNSCSGTKILDYGCGDGSVVQLLDESYELSLFDISKKFLSLAQQNLERRNYTIYHDNLDIPSNYYDCVIFSLVLMTIDSKDTIKKTLKEIQRVKRKDGIMIFAVTHPCFRQYSYSTFYTEFTKSKEFKYLADGAKFSVYLKDLITKEQINFDDYHWSLSTTFNLIIKSDFRITKVIELQDAPVKGSTFNSNFPPYLIIICQ